MGLANEAKRAGDGDVGMTDCRAEPVRDRRSRRGLAPGPPAQSPICAVQRSIQVCEVCGWKVRS